MLEFRDQLIAAGFGNTTPLTPMLLGEVTWEKPVRFGINPVVAGVNLGAYSYVGGRCDIYYANIGRYCSIADDVRIGSSPHNIDGATTHPFPYQDLFSFLPDGPKPYEAFDDSLSLTTIEDDVWVGNGVSIISARPITIGRGAILGARSVVTRDVEPYTIVVGSPSRPLRKRFDATIIEALSASAWWTFDLPRYATDYPDDAPPMREVRRFLDWCDGGGLDRAKTYAFGGTRYRLRPEGDQVQMDQLTL